MKRHLQQSALVLLLLLVFAVDCRAGRSLEQIREEIRANGWNFSVDHNWVYDLPEEAKQRLFKERWIGWRKQFPLYEGPVLSRADLPAAFDWRNVNGHSYVGPVRNQGACGSCYAFAAVGVLESAFRIAEELPDTDVNLSESYLMFCLSRYYDGFYGCEGASYDYDELQALVDHGVVEEDCFPYDQGRTADCGASCDSPSMEVRLSSWGRIPCNDVEAIKSAILTYGPVDAAVMATDAFSAYSGGIYNDLNQTCPGSPCYFTTTNHAVVLVGWNDADQAWILRNSWGPNWGEGGYMRISYRAARVACEVTYGAYSALAPFQTLEPTNGQSLTSAPTLYWTKGPYDWFVPIVFLPLYGRSGYTTLPLGWTQENLLPFPSRLWTYTRSGIWSGWMVLGVDTGTYDYDTAGPQFFMKAQ